MVWLAVVWIAGCGSKKAQRAEEQGDQGGATAVQSQVPRVRLPYVIPEAGVHFNPPLSWDPDRIQLVTRSGEAAASVLSGVDHAVSFEYKAEQPAHANSPLLNLYVLHRAEASRVSAKLPDSVVIDSTSDWVFIARLPKDNPYRSGLLDADQFDAMRMTMADVRDAFTIESSGPSDATLRAESQRR